MEFSTYDRFDLFKIFHDVQHKPAEIETVVPNNILHFVTYEVCIYGIWVILDWSFEGDLACALIYHEVLQDASFSTLL